MKKNQSIALMAASALMSLAGFTACSSSNDMDEAKNPNVEVDKQGNEGVRPEFVISIPRSVVSGTRMSDAVTQKDGTSAVFRGMDHIRLIPFAEEPNGNSTKLGSIMSLSSVASNGLKQPGSLNYKVYADQFVPMTTTHFLFYGKAIDNTAETNITTMADKFKYGFIKATGLTDAEFTKPNSISFGMEQINTSTEQQQSNAVGRNIVNFMTSLANITATGEAPNNAWSTCTDARLKPLYDAYITATVSSSTNFAAILGMLNDGVARVVAAQPANALAVAIKDMIASACSVAPVVGSSVTLKADYAGYPGNVGLPDGAARVRWNHSSKKFEDITANYGGGLKVGITDYVYPAALWYFVSTPLKASDAVQSGNYDSKAAWDKVISEVYSAAGSEVISSTLSVALVNPVQYAVGRLETKLEMGTGTFYDGAGKEVATGEGYTLKGLLLGGQNDVKYDFTTSSANKNWTIYDREAPAGIIVKPGVTTSKANQTLALETKADEKVYAAVELVNGGEAFQGADGIIPAGGTFYLTVKLDPTTAANYSSSPTKKIVTQDYVTKVTVKIKNGAQSVDKDGDGNPDKYVKDENGVPIGVDTGDGNKKTEYDINGDGTPDKFITDPDKGGPGWDTDGDGVVDIPVVRDPSTGEYPDNVLVPEGLGNATNGIPNLITPGIELGTSVDLEWKQGLELTPSI